MVSFNRSGFGEHSQRIVVANYGYVFTLTLDGMPAPKEGIGNIVQVKPKNEITLSVPNSAVRDSEVTRDIQVRHRFNILLYMDIMVLLKLYQIL